MDHAGHVDRHHPVPTRDVGLARGIKAEREAGVVDEDVDVLPAGRKASRQSGNRSRVRHIQRERQ
jgi:hypothetical protein